MRIAKKFLALLLALGMVFQLSACATNATGNTPGSSGTVGSAPIAGAASGKDTAVVAITSDPANLCPTAPNAASIAAVVFQMYTHLMNLEDGQFVPEAAKSVEYADDTHIVVTLRDDIYDANGNNFTAADLLFSLKLCPDGSGAVPNYVRYVDLENCIVEDTYVLNIAMTAPYPAQFYYLCRLNLVTEAGYQQSKDGMLTDVVATGPYKLVEYVTGSSVTLTANENWFGEVPEIKDITFRVITESSQITNSLEAGSIDWGQIATSDIAYMDGKDGADVDIVTSSMAGYFFNTSESSVFHSKEARKAVAYIIDAAAMCANCTDSYASVAQTPFVPTVTDYSNHWDEAYKQHDNYYAYDQKKGQELADAAGLTGQTVVLTYTSAQTTQKTMAEMAQNMLSAIGVNATIEVYDDSVYTTTIASENNWDISFQYFGSSDGTSVGTLTNFLVNQNLSHLSGDVYDQLVELTRLAGTTVDEAQRQAYADEILDIMMEEIPFMGCFTVINAYGHIASLTGVQYNCVSAPIFRNAHFT